MTTTLEKTGLDLEGLVVRGKKTDPFIGAVEIAKPQNKIVIPEEASLMRKKGGRVQFYRFIPDAGGYIPIPEEALWVQFPEYQRNSGHIMYGKHIFTRV